MPGHTPSYPPAPAGQGDLGIAVLSRWPILVHERIVMPARHREWDPVAPTVRVGHPAGPLPIVAACDHIFFRPGREDQQVLVEGVQLAGEPVDGVHPSDHRAVVADLRRRG